VVTDSTTRKRKRKSAPPFNPVAVKRLTYLLTDFALLDRLMCGVDFL